MVSICAMKENQNQSQFPPFSIQANASCAILLNPTQDHHEPLNDYFSAGGSSSNSYDLDQANDQMSSKMRLMRKMMGSDKIIIKKKRKTQSSHDQVQINQASSSNNATSDVIRVCSNCNTTKTPLWRSGPQGPKSLCNACGIRQMKARRAMRVAAERTNMDRTVPFKKRFKINVSSSSAQKKLRLEDITISLTNKLPFQQAFPQEEKDAALLLMALSCGLIHG